MPEVMLKVLDWALTRALEVFLFGFCAYLVASRLACKWRTHRIVRGLTSRFRKQNPGQDVDARMLDAWRSYLEKWDVIRAALHAALWSAGAACLLFLFLCFTPWPEMSNFATVRNQPPLRVTWLLVDPSPEGYRVEGDVWNQSEGTLSVTVAVTLLDDSGAALGSFVAPVAPQELSTREKGDFHLSLGSASRATKFSLKFIGDNGRELEYAKGFPGSPTQESRGNAITRSSLRQR